MKLSRIRWSSSTPASVSLTASVSDLTSPSPAAPEGTSTRPGLTQNWPTPSVIEPARPVPMASARSAAAASVTTTGFSEPSSPWKGIGVGRAAAASNRARPPRIEPVKPAAATSGCLISSTPASKPWTRPSTSAGMPCSAAALRTHLGDQLGQARVVGVGLDDDRVAGRQRAGGVAARDREREGEVRRRVHGHHAERHLVAAQVGDGRGGGVVGVVDDDVEERALVDDVGERAQLVAGAGEFAVQPDRAERGLRVGHLDERVLGRLAAGRRRMRRKAARTVRSAREPRAS